MSSLRLEHFDENKNEEGLRLCNETIDEVRDTALGKIISQKQAISRRYNAKVKRRHLQVGDLVLKKAEFSAVEKRDGKLGANWEGPYKVIQILTPGTYKFEDMQGKVLTRPWNIQHLKKYYQ